MSKKKYHIAPDVTHVNGVKLKKGVTTIDLNDAEALYDLSVGRISEKPFAQAKASEKPDPSKGGGQNDESKNETESK